MEETLQQFQHLKIQLKDIKSATNDFNDEKNRIGVGGFGKVYKGEVSHSMGRSMVAIKRLNPDPRHGQGKTEFLKEMMVLSRYRHENLITLLGFCYEEKEVILVYEYASRLSLDRHLNSPDLTWARRLKICLDAAKGLCYLHDPRGTHQRLIHRDMKSANILLDDRWNAKVADFGLSIMGPANEEDSVVVANTAGTGGYWDPKYVRTQTLTKESDVYSFGVVLFEVLCGTLCCTYRNGRVEKNFVPMWIESYKQKKLNDIIFKHQTIQPLDEISLEIFSDIAYRCLNESREDRPKMAEVVTELETALEIQDFGEQKLLFDYEEMTKSAESSLNYNSNGELWKLLSKGVLLNGGNTWFSLNKNGEHCEMISFAECLDSIPSQLEYYSWSGFKSRFAAGPYHYKNMKVKARVKPQFLSPQIIYTVNLVFMFAYPKKPTKSHEYICLKHKLQGENQSSISYLAYEREDGWWMCELYQLTSDHRTVDLEILFDGFHSSYNVIGAEGIEFWPLEKVEHKDEKQPIIYSDANWEEKLPTNYVDIIKWSKNSVQWTTKKEAYSIICKGFLLSDGQEWFSLDNNGKKCHMLSARVAGISTGECIDEKMDWMPLHESRFGEVLECDFWKLRIDTKIQSQLLSSLTTYVSYLVYKLPETQFGSEAPLLVNDSVSDWYIYLASPTTPVIRPKADQNTHNLSNRPKLKGLPQHRTDGWMEVQIWEFQTATTTQIIPMCLKFYNCGFEPLSGLIIQGVEFRPM